VCGCRGLNPPWELCRRMEETTLPPLLPPLLPADCVSEIMRCCLDDADSSSTSAALRATCSTWLALHDRLLHERRLNLNDSTFPTDEQQLLERRWPALRSLKLTGAKADGVCMSMPTSFVRSVCQLSALTRLSLRAVQTGGWPGSQHLLGSLTCLSLRDCGVPSCTLRALSSLTSLTTLHLAGSTTYEAGWMQLAEASTTLTELNLHGCVNLTDEALRALATQLPLRTLDVGGGRRLCDERMRSLCLCTSLTSLSLADTHGVTAARMAMLRALPSLTSLDLEDSDAHMPSISTLAFMPKLGGPKLECVIMKGTPAFAKMPNFGNSAAQWKFMQAMITHFQAEDGQALPTFENMQII
jgi:hypothetical protein